MKLISLNTWGGRVYEPLMTFIKEQSVTTDIFCFQEVYHTTSNETTPKAAGSLSEKKGQFQQPDPYRANLFTELSRALPDFTGHFAPAVDGYDHDGPVNYHLEFGLATFVRNSLAITEQGDTFVYRDRFMPREVLNGSTQARNVQHTVLDTPHGPLTVFNFHGLWWFSSKDDVEVRLEQTKRLKEAMNRFDTGKILCGDFNMNPGIESLKMLEEGMRNLISEYSITDTRGPLYPKPNRYADYCLTSPDIRINSFVVPPVPISDHLPLVLDFQLTSPAE